jgi:hypothetical protein
MDKNKDEKLVKQKARRYFNFIEHDCLLPMKGYREKKECPGSRVKAWYGTVFRAVLCKSKKEKGRRKNEIE